MIEWITPSFVYSLAKDGIGLFRGSRRRLSPAEIIELRKKWKPQFEEYVWKRYKDQLRTDVIIRDVKRLDRYPDAEAGSRRGISPWFRLGLSGTYHRGINVGHMWGSLTKEGEDFRFTNYKAGEKGDIKVLLMSSIPYENIENVDWDGDEYYSFPHIYCYFDRKREPYEHTGVYLKTEPRDTLPFFTEVGNYKEIRKRSRRQGLEYFS